MTTGTYSPTPWTADGSSIRAGDGRWIAYLDHVGVDFDANAAFIVKAVNAYEPMLASSKEALQALHQLHPQQERIPVGVGICEWAPCRQLREAIAIAEGKERIA